MPLLYYTSSLLFDLGADVFWVEYGYNQRPDFQGLSNEERERWFFTDVAAASSVISAFRPYTQVTLVGKSLGTLAITLLLTYPQYATSQGILLTPLLKDDRVRLQIQKATQRLLLAVGTNDKQYDPAFLEELKATSQARIIVLEGADHSLEIKGELLKSISFAEQLIREIEKFVARETQ
jgi:hypothetical protein